MSQVPLFCAVLCHWFSFYFISLAVVGIVGVVVVDVAALLRSLLKLQVAPVLLLVAYPPSRLPSFLPPSHHPVECCNIIFVLNCICRALARPATIRRNPSSAYLYFAYLQTPQTVSRCSLWAVSSLFCEKEANANTFWTTYLQDGMRGTSTHPPPSSQARWTHFLHWTHIAAFECIWDFGIEAAGDGGFFSPVFLIGCHKRFDASKSIPPSVGVVFIYIVRSVPDWLWMLLEEALRLAS